MDQKNLFLYDKNFTIGLNMQTSKPSIIGSTIRAFLSSFAIVIGIFVAFILLIIGLACLPDHIETPEKRKLVIQPDADGNRKLLPESTPVILKIDIVGIVGEGALTKTQIEKMLLDAQESPLNKDRVKGILLRMKTPGGVAFEAEGIYLALKAFKAKHKIPVYAYVDGISASGGVMISCAADQIYSAPSSIVGSVGVILGPVFNFSEGMTKIGISSKTFTDGKDKDMLNPFRPWEEGEGAPIESIIKAHYEHFVHIVTTSRPRIDKEKLINVYGANVFDNAKAQEYGYIDVADSTYSRVLSDLVKAAEIKEGSKYQVLQFKKEDSLLSLFMEEKLSLLKGKVTHTFDTGSNFKPELSGKVLYLYPGVGATM